MGLAMPYGTADCADFADIFKYIKSVEFEKKKR